MENDYRVTVTSTGSVYWLFGKKYETSCPMDVTYFPFDRQQCILQFASWMNSNVNFTSTFDVVKLDWYAQNGEWTLRDTDASHMVYRYKNTLSDATEKFFCAQKQTWRALIDCYSHTNIGG